MAAGVAWNVLVGAMLGSLILGGAPTASAQTPPAQLPAPPPPVPAPPAKTPSLVISELVADKAAFSLPRPGTWTRPFVVYATAGSTPIANVKIRVTSFQGATTSV